MKDVPCAYCDASVLSTAFVLCASCEVPVHRDCWAESARCPTYGCGATATLDPAVALFRRSAPAGEVAATPAAPRHEPAAEESVEPLSGAIARAVGVVESVVAAIAEGATGAGRARALVPAAKPAPPAQAAPPALEASARQAEIARLESELHRMTMRSWLRMLAIVGWTLMMPLMFKEISKNLVFPAVLVLIALATWPAAPRGTRARKKALAKRLAELEALPAE